MLPGLFGYPADASAANRSGQPKIPLGLLYRNLMSNRSGGFMSAERDGSSSDLASVTKIPFLATHSRKIIRYPGQAG